jgi:lipopolysaccharide transport system permease protein
MKSTKLVIDAQYSVFAYCRDLWHYRELLLFLAWRDILVRYKQTLIGMAWAALRPLLTMVVFVIVFAHIANLPSDGVPYPLLVFAALLPWQLFSEGVVESSNSLIVNEHLISKTYFPRLLVPLSAIAVSLVDYLFGLIILFAMMVYYEYTLTWRLMFLPIITLVALAASAGTGIWLAALNVHFRDFRYVIPFLIQAGLYISPVGYSLALVPPKYRLFYSLNPMAGVIDGFRWALLDSKLRIHPIGLLLSVILTCTLLTGGIWYFRTIERNMTDSL